MDIGLSKAQMNNIQIEHRLTKLESDIKRVEITNYISLLVLLIGIAKLMFGS